MELQTFGNIDDELKKLELKTKELELKHKKWEFLFKLAGLLTIGFGIALPIWQYYLSTTTKNKDDIAQGEKEVRTATREVQKPFLERQMQLYFEAVTNASKLTRLADERERVKARNRFYELYFGELSVVEDRVVESAMVRFADALDAREQNRKPTSYDDKTDEGVCGEYSSSTPKLNAPLYKCLLESRSLDLAHACRDSMARGWDYKREEPK